MKKFNQIVCLDNTKLNAKAIKDLEEFSEGEVKVYHDTPGTNKEIIERIGNAQAVIVSWKTEIDKNVIKACPNMEYIGMACSLYDEKSANVDVRFARKRGITVTGIKDYGDPGVSEFIVSELIQLMNGYKEQQWKEMPVELRDARVGIIGLGVTGQLLAKALLGFGAEVSYFSRSRKPDWEEKGVTYKELDELLEFNDIISFHLPRNTVLIDKKKFELLGSGKILINTSLGLPFPLEEFKKWVSEDNNYAIFDGDGGKVLEHKVKAMEGVITHNSSAGWSLQTQERLSQKVLENLKSYCEN